MPISVTPNGPTGLGATRSRSRKFSIASPFWALFSLAVPVAAVVVVDDDEAEGVFES